jgi:hypothetical protein
MRFKNPAITEMKSVRNQGRMAESSPLQVLRGIEKIIIPTPTNAAQPKRSYSEMKASVT